MARPMPSNAEFTRFVFPWYPAKSVLQNDSQGVSLLLAVMVETVESSTFTVAGDVDIWLPSVMVSPTVGVLHTSTGTGSVVPSGVMTIGRPTKIGVGVGVGVARGDEELLQTTTQSTMRYPS